MNTRVCEKDQPTQAHNSKPQHVYVSTTKNKITSYLIAEINFSKKIYPNFLKFNHYLLLGSFNNYCENLNNIML